jgi:hypothetical protein
VSNCVTKPTNYGGQRRTPADHRRRGEALRPKAAPPLKLLWDKEVVGSKSASPTVETSGQGSDPHRGSDPCRPRAGLQAAFNQPLSARTRPVERQHQCHNGNADQERSA